MRGRFRLLRRTLQRLPLVVRHRLRQHNERQNQLLVRRPLLKRQPYPDLVNSLATGRQPPHRLRHRPLLKPAVWRGTPYPNPPPPFAVDNAHFPPPPNVPPKVANDDDKRTPRKPPQKSDAQRQHTVRVRMRQPFDNVSKPLPLGNHKVLLRLPPRHTRRRLRHHFDKRPRLPLRPPKKKHFARRAVHQTRRKKLALHHQLLQMLQPKPLVQQLFRPTLVPLP